MDDFKSVRSGDRDSGRSEIMGFKSERYFYRPFIFHHFDKKLRPYYFNSGPYIFKGDRLVC